MEPFVSLGDLGEAHGNAVRRQRRAAFSFAISALRHRSGPGRTSSVRSSNFPARSRSTAIAPITALSVQSDSGGMCSS